MTTSDEISEIMDELKNMLIQKNEQYGDSVMNPVRVFSKSPPKELLKIRLDDKLSRLARGNDSIEDDEDVVKDLIGYLTLLLIMMRRESP